MDVLVVGAGAVGTFLGGTLALAGHAVSLAGRDGSAPGRIELLDRAGRARVATIRRVVVPRGEVADAAARLDRPPELAVLAVKMFDLAGAIDAIAGWPSAAVLTIQNGIGAEDAVVARRPGGPLIAGSLTAALERDGGTTVRMTNRGALGLAPVSAGTADLLPALAAAFSVGGLPARTMTDAASMKWSKLLTNLVGNATSAILDLEPHAIYADARLFEVEQGQMLEALAVMAARRLRPIALPAADARLLAVAFRLPPAVARRVLARAVGGARGGKWPSLAAHLRSGTGGPTEARWLNGAVALAGEAAGVATPINRVLAGLVDEAAADPARRDWYRGRPDRLLDVLASSA